VNRAHTRRIAAAAGVLATLTACNAILGITDLVDPGPLPGADAADTDGPTAEGSTADAGADARDANLAPDVRGDADASPGDAGLPLCSAQPAADPCLVIEAQDGGSSFPTWEITSDLTMQGQNVAVVQPTKPVYVDAGAGAVTEIHSKLTWQSRYQTSADGVTYDGAVQACASIGPGWRVPTYLELSTVQHRAAPPSSGYLTDCTPPVFGSDSYVATWSSSSVPQLVPEQKYVHNEGPCGYTSNPVTAQVPVRCVKGDPKPATFVVSKSRNVVLSLDTRLEWERTGTVVQSFAEAKAHCDQLGWRLPVIQEVYGIIDLRTTNLFNGALFAPPTTPDAAAPRAILSQTVYAVLGGVTYYQAVATNNAPWAFEDQVPPDDLQRDILLRCVHYVPSP
jgi:hypothetical protein